MRRGLLLLLPVGLAACSESPRAGPATALTGLVAIASPAFSARASWLEPTKVCEDRPDATLFASPKTPNAGAPLRILAATEAPLDATLTLTSADGTVIARSTERRGGPPS